MKFKKIALFFMIFGAFTTLSGCAKDIADSLSAGLDQAFPKGPTPSPVPHFTQQVTLDLPVAPGTPVWIDSNAQKENTHLVPTSREGISVTLTIDAMSQDNLAAAVKEATNLKCDTAEGGKAECRYFLLGASINSFTMEYPEGGVPDSFYHLTPLSSDPVTTSDLHLLFMNQNAFDEDTSEFALLQKWTNPTAFLTVSDLTTILFLLSSDDNRLKMIQILGPYVTDADDDKIRGYMSSAGFRDNGNVGKAQTLLRQLAPRPPQPLLRMRSLLRF